MSGRRGQGTGKQTCFPGEHKYLSALTMSFFDNIFFWQCVFLTTSFFESLDMLILNISRYVSFAFAFSLFFWPSPTSIMEKNLMRPWNSIYQWLRFSSLLAQRFKDVLEHTCMYTYIFWKLMTPTIHWPITHTGPNQTHQTKDETLSWY